jgi:hypothetical protein
MKKSILLTLAVSALALASCKRTYTCECVQTTNGQDAITTQAPIKSTKSAAKSSCEAGNSSASTSGLVIVRTCKLK